MQILKDAEIPREGIFIRRQPSVTRRADSTYARWTTRRIGVGRGESASQLASESAIARKLRPNQWRPPESHPNTPKEAQAAGPLGLAYEAGRLAPAGPGGPRRGQITSSFSWAGSAGNGACGSVWYQNAVDAMSSWSGR